MKPALLWLSLYSPRLEACGLICWHRDAPDEHSERQLEQALLANVELFLQEMGGMFAFIGSQYRLEISNNV